MLLIRGLFMEVKGTAVSILPEFIKRKYGEEDFNRFFDKLPDSSKEIFSSPISLDKWYPLKEAFVVPTEIYCNTFQKGDFSTAKAIGAYSAEKALRTTHKLYLTNEPISILLKKAEVLLPSYYRPCKMEFIEATDVNCLLRITQFPEIHTIIEYRILGWIEQGLIFVGANIVKAEITKSLVTGDECTEILIRWINSKKTT